MRKTLLIAAILVAVLAAAGAVGYAYAQRPTPPSTPYGFGPGMMAGRGGQGHMYGGRGAGMMGAYADGQGPLHKYMVNAFAKALDMTPEDLDARLSAGETMWQVAQAQGLTDEQITDLMITTRAEALQQAVADGVLSQEQADWMSQRMQQGQFGNGNCPMHDNDGDYTPRNGRWNNQP